MEIATSFFISYLRDSLEFEVDLKQPEPGITQDNLPAAAPHEHVEEQTKPEVDLDKLPADFRDLITVKEKFCRVTRHDVNLDFLTLVRPVWVDWFLWRGCGYEFA